MDCFELQWNDFHDNFSSSFKDLREEGELCDITLACDDDQIEAHKIILSASSSFFKSVIKRNPHVHPLLYLKGVRITELKSLLDFIYLGKTKVDQKHVQSFLALGEELGVKGLVRSKEIEDPRLASSEEITVEEAMNENFEIIDIKMEKVKKSDDVDTLIDFEETVVEEVENVDEVLQKFISEKQSMDVSVDCNDDSVNKTNYFTMDADVDEQIQSFLKRAKNSEGKIGCQCSECNKYSKTKSNMRMHVETHLEGLSFACKYCGKVCKTRNSRNKHMYTSQQCKSKRN